MRKLKVYIANPYTIPEDKQLQNVYNSFKVFDELSKLGFIPFAPLTSHFIHEKYPQKYAFWLEYDYEWLSVCDCLLRLEGTSLGADEEVEYAKQNGVVVFYTIQSLIEYRESLLNKELGC
jgi:hypothetical protein